MESVAKVITVENASSCTPFELRQELVKRGAMDIPDNEANYRSMLKRLMVELVADEEKRSETRRLEIEAKQKEDRDRLKEERERKKQEALERSKQRREMDPSYFEKRKQEAKEAEEAQKAMKEAKKAELEQLSDDGEDNETAQAEGDPKLFDPFRSYQPKSRSKIFVK